MAGFLDEPALQARFMRGLDALWSAWTAQHHHGDAAPPLASPPPQKRARGRPHKQPRSSPHQPSLAPGAVAVAVTDASVAPFFAALPRAPVAACAALAQVAPLRAKGRKRLREMHDGGARAAKRARDTAPPPAPAPAPSQPQPHQAPITAFTQVRKAALLDRILAKQDAAGDTAATDAAAGPARARMAALQRAGDVLDVLALLAASRAADGGLRVSFPLSALVQALQTSAPCSRSPLARDEALRCVEVLAADVAPGYVALVRTPAFTGVTINRAARPARRPRPPARPRRRVTPDARERPVVCRR